jgi:hypothetical protein
MNGKIAREERAKRRAAMDAAYGPHMFDSACPITHVLVVAMVVAEIKALSEGGIHPKYQARLLRAAEWLHRHGAPNMVWLNYARALVRDIYGFDKPQPPAPVVTPSSIPAGSCLALVQSNLKAHKAAKARCV